MPETDAPPGPAAERRSNDPGRLAVAACWAVGGAYLATLTFRDGAPPSWFNVSLAAAFLPHGWVAAVLAWHAARLPALEPRTARGWGALAAGFAVLATNNLVFYAVRRGLIPDSAYLIAETALPLAWAALALLGLGALVRAPRNRLEQARFWLDTTTVFCAGCLILLYVFGRTPGASSLGSPRAALLTVGIPALDGAVLFAAATVLLRPALGVSRAAIGVIAASVAVSVVADLAYGRTVFGAGHRPGAWYGAAYMIASLLWVTAAQLQREPRFGAPARIEGPWTSSSMIPYAMVGGAILILLTELGSRWNTTLGRLVLGAVALALLVMARQLIVRLETEQLAALERAHDRRFRALVEHASDMISVVDRDGVVAYQAGDTGRALGRAPGDLMGSSLVALAHPDDADRVRASIVGGSVPDRVLRWRARHASGEWRELETTVTDLTGEPTVAGVVLNTRDLTAHARLESQLNQARKLEAVGLLAGGVAHDFNNILAAIRASAELAADESTTDAARRDDIREITHAVDRAAALTRQLLTFGRRDVIRPEVLDVRSVVAGLEPVLRRLIPPEITLDVALPDHAVPVRGDPTQVEQVVLNLCVNARDALRGPGTIAVAVASRAVTEPAAAVPPGTYAAISVSDTGPGIEPALMDRIFEPFFTTKAGGQGSGLGLSTVYGIAQRAGGAVTVHSTPGTGAEFMVFIPLAEGESPMPGALSPRRSGEVTERGGRTGGRAPLPGSILVVDDEPAIRATLARYLTALGYTVHTADGGAEAMRLLSEPVCDVAVIVSDLTMPGMSGWELVDAATALRPSLRVVIMSGYAQVASMPATRPAAVTGVLTKPFDLGELGATIRAALACDPAARSD